MVGYCNQFKYAFFTMVISMGIYRFRLSFLFDCNIVCLIKLEKRVIKLILVNSFRSLLWFCHGDKIYSLYFACDVLPLYYFMEEI